MGSALGHELKINVMNTKHATIRNPAKEFNAKCTEKSSKSDNDNKRLSSCNASNYILLHRNNQYCHRGQIFL